MKKSTVIEGMVISAADVQKHWNKIIQNLKDSPEPIFVCTDNMPDAVILSYLEFKKMQAVIELAHREQLGQKMENDLIDIAKLTNQPIKHMYANANGVFEEIKPKKA